MRTLSSAVLVAFAFPLAAQGMTWGLSAGVTLSNFGDLHSVGGPSTNGWTAGVAVGPRVPLKALGLRLDLAYTDLGYQNDVLTGPGYSSVPSNWHAVSAGASADLMWNVLGAGKTTSPYLLVGAGWYAVRTVSSSGVDAPETSVNGQLSYNGGLGLRFSRFFIEARAIVYHDIHPPLGDGGDYYNYPVTIGVWF